MPLTAPMPPKPVPVRPRGNRFIAWLLRGLHRFVFGQTKKGEPIPDKVYFHTTYPDKRPSEDQWFRMLGIRKQRRKQ